MENIPEEFCENSFRILGDQIYFCMFFLRGLESSCAKYQTSKTNNIYHYRICARDLSTNVHQKNPGQINHQEKNDFSTKVRVVPFPESDRRSMWGRVLSFLFLTQEDS